MVPVEVRQEPHPRRSPQESRSDKDRHRTFSFDTVSGGVYPSLHTGAGGRDSGRCSRRRAQARPELTGSTRLERRKRRSPCRRQARQWDTSSLGARS